MMNAISAYIVTIFLIALLKARPSFQRGDERLRLLPYWVQVPLLLLFLGMALHTALGWFGNYAIITLPDFIITSLNVWVHEAGHFYFSWDGEFLHSFGGTLNEILFPLVPAVFCYRKKYFALLSLFLYWFGHNCFGIAKYIADARARSLPLLAGTEGHDWNTMLGMLKLLEHDSSIALGVTILGWLMLVTVFCIYVSTCIWKKVVL